jgi:hypothetical protein
VGVPAERTERCANGDAQEETRRAEFFQAGKEGTPMMLPAPLVARELKIIWLANGVFPPEPVKYLPDENGNPPVPRAFLNVRQRGIDMDAGPRGERGSNVLMTLTTPDLNGAWPYAHAYR